MAEPSYQPRGKRGARGKSLRLLPALPAVLLITLIAAAQDFDQLAAQAARAREASRVEEAVALYRRALSLRPRWGEGWFYLATLLYERDAYAEASQAFEEATDLNPQVGTAWVMLGLCEFKLGRYDAALNHLLQGRRLGITDNPHLRSVMLYHEGLLLLEKGEFEAAQKTLGTLSKEGAESEDLTVALGLSALRLRPSQLPAADAATREAVSRAGRAEGLAVNKKFDEALGEYGRLAADFPKTPNVQYAYGRFLLTSNRDEKAVEAFRREIENSPNHLMSRLMIADTKIRLKDAAGGLPYAEEAVKLRPQLPLGHYLLGLALLETGQTARAVTELETAQKSAPGESKIYFALGRAYARVGRAEEAERARATFTRLSKEQEAAEQPKPE